MSSTIDLVQKASIALHDAAANAPARSNLQDELRGLAEQVDRVHDAMASSRYDSAGMERG